MVRLVIHRLIVLCLVFCAGEFAQANQTSLPVTYSYRIDTSNILTNDAVRTWVEYLQSRPDSVRENPLWPETDRNDRFSFDASRVWIFQSQEFMNRYPPMILSAEIIEPDRVLIKTLFQGIDEHNSVYPLALYNIYAIKGKYGWYLEHVLQKKTEDWRSKTIGGITFVMSPKHMYSSNTARKAVRFCDSLTALFDLTDIEEAKYFVTTSKDELAEILGFDYYVAPPSGLTYPEKDYIISALNSEWHSHELAHLVFRSYAKTHHFVTEGVATWCGGSLGQSFEALMIDFINVHKNRSSELSFDSVLTAGQKESLAYYAIAALLCKEVFLLHGGSGLKTMMNDCVGNNVDIKAILSKHLGIDSSAMDSFISKKLGQYASVLSD